MSLFFLCISCFICTKGYIYELWSTEHLDDMILSDAFKKGVPARSPAVIALYETECKSKLYQTYGYSADNLPNQMTLIETSFDRKLAQNVWYEWMPEIMDVFIRYNLSYIDDDGNVIDRTPKSEWCPTVLFQPADWNEPLIQYNHLQDEPFNQWVWTNLVIQELTFINTLNKNINILLKTNDIHDERIENEMIITQIPSKQTINIKSGDDIGIILHAGDTIHALDDNNNVINRYLLNTVNKIIEIEQSDDKDVLDDDRYLKKRERELKLLNSQDWSTRRRYLNNIRTPEYMPGFTETGFKYSVMPQEMCDYLQEFVKDNESRKRREGFPKDGTQINAREISTFMIHIPGDKKRWIGDLLQPLLEEWSGTKLKYSTIYGVREYIRGAVLKTHCDRVETHIISAILHINHDPLDIPWPIEVVGWEGKRHYIDDAPCTMTFYESAKLIHGRPSTYNGTAWYNAFLHYRPADWNGYKFTSDNKLITPTHEIALVDWIYG